MIEESSFYRKAFARYLRYGMSIELQMKAASEQGPRKYIWVTQGDGKVRPSHVANEGKIFSYDDPPATGDPGDDYGCRCVAVPYEADDRQLYPDAIEPVYPELFLPVFRFGRLLRGLYRAIQDRGAGTLTGEQAKNLARFDDKLPKDAGPISITAGKNGQRTFSSDVPARNIPGSFARYEKTVDSAGKTVSYTKTTYATDGSIVHSKIKY